MRSTWMALGITLGLAAAPPTRSRSCRRSVTCSRASTSSMPRRGAVSSPPIARATTSSTSRPASASSSRPSIAGGSDRAGERGRHDDRRQARHPVLRPARRRRLRRPDVEPEDRDRKSTKLAAGLGPQPRLRARAEARPAVREGRRPVARDEHYHIHVMGLQATPDQDPGLVAAADEDPEHAAPHHGRPGVLERRRLVVSARPPLLEVHLPVRRVTTARCRTGSSRTAAATIQIVENYCNHGTCAGSMGWECDHYSDWRYNPTHDG